MNLQALVLCCIAAGNTLAQAQVVEIKNTVPSTPPIATEAPAVSEDFTVLEQEMLDLINEARENAGLLPAQANDALHEMAQVRAQEIMVSFSHERPNGTKVDLMHEIGITPQNYCAENILSGTDVSTPQSMMNCFMNSEPHRAWILSEEINAVGVAIVQNEYGQFYAVQSFGCF